MPQSELTLSPYSNSSLLNFVRKQFKTRGFSMDEQAIYAMDRTLKQAVQTSISELPPKRESANTGRTRHVSEWAVNPHRIFVPGRESIRGQQGKRVARRIKELTSSPLELAVASLTRDIIRHQRNGVITQNDIDAALLRLCPLWPFCR